MRINKLIVLPVFIIMFCFLSFPTNGEDKFESIFFEPEVGDSFVLKIHNKKLKFKDNTKIQEMKGITKVNVVIESKNEEYYNVLWKYNKTDIQSVYPPDDTVTPLLEDLNRGLTVSFKVDSVGTIVGINNKEEIKAYMKEAVDKIINSLDSKGLPPGITDNLKKQFYSMFTNENYFQQTILKEPALFYNGYGLNFAEGKIITYETDLPNPLSGTPITAKGEYHLSGTPENYVISWKQNIDPEKAKTFILDFLKKFDQNISSEQLPLLDISDSATFKFKGNSLILLDHERKTEALDQKRIDHIKIEMENI